MFVQAMQEQRCLYSSLHQRYLHMQMSRIVLWKSLWNWYIHLFSKTLWNVKCKKEYLTPCLAWSITAQLFEHKNSFPLVIELKEDFLRQHWRTLESACSVVCSNLLLNHSHDLHDNFSKTRWAGRRTKSAF